MTKKSRFEVIRQHLIDGSGPEYRHPDLATDTARRLDRELKLHDRPGFPWLGLLAVIAAVTMVINMLAILRAFYEFDKLIDALQTLGKCVQ